MEIGICDNEALWRDKEERILREYFQKNGVNHHITKFETAEEMFSFNAHSLDVLLLDIELGDTDSGNGIAVAKKINEKWPDCEIIYVTNYLLYATDVYETGHVYFVLKDQFEDRLYAVINKVRQTYNAKKKNIIFSVINKGIINLSPDEIIYFERDKRITKVITDDGIYEVWDSMNKIMEKLPLKEFVRCHNSYIVHLNAVKKLDKTQFVMKNNDKIGISRSYLKHAKDAYMSWAEDYMS